MVKSYNDIRQDEHDDLQNAKRIINARGRNTSFNETVTALRTSKFNNKLTWGVSRLRDTKIELNGGTIIENGGEGKLSTSTNIDGYVELRTKERGQYQAGTEGEIGLGIRMPLLPTGNQFVEWGYFDDDNGFGYGVDSTGKYVFRDKGGVREQKDYQQDWNQDKLDGSKDTLTNSSGIKLDLSRGNIFQINFVWYGYGTIEFYLNVKDPALNNDKRVLIHSIQVEESISIIDPNQPINIRANNGGTAENIDVYVGGRQFAIVDGDSGSQLRDTPANRDAFSVANDTDYEPFMAVRKKDIFNGRQNSVRSSLKRIKVASTEKLYWYVSFGDTVADGTWTDIDFIPSDETGLEQNIGLTLANTTQFRAIAKDVIPVATQGSATPQIINVANRSVLGEDDPIVFWAKNDGTTATVDLILEFEEEW